MVHIDYDSFFFKAWMIYDHSGRPTSRHVTILKSEDETHME